MGMAVPRPDLLLILSPEIGPAKELTSSFVPMTRVCIGSLFSVMSNAIRNQRQLMHLKSLKNGSFASILITLWKHANPNAHKLKQAQLSLPTIIHSQLANKKNKSMKSIM